MKANHRFSYEKDWRSAPLAFWVHLPVKGSVHEFEPPAPLPLPHLGYPMLRVEFEAHELIFSAPAQLKHFVDILARKPLPTTRALAARRGLPIGPNAHWLSRLPAVLKSPRKRERLVRALREILTQVDGPGAWRRHSAPDPKAARPATPP